MKKSISWGNNPVQEQGYLDKRNLTGPKSFFAENRVKNHTETRIALGFQLLWIFVLGCWGEKLFEAIEKAEKAQDCGGSLVGKNAKIVTMNPVEHRMNVRK